MFTCGNCGAENPENTRFCGYCGKALANEQKASAVMNDVVPLPSAESGGPIAGHIPTVQGTPTPSQPPNAAMSQPTSVSTVHTGHMATSPVSPQGAKSASHMSDSPMTHEQHPLETVAQRLHRQGAHAVPHTVVKAGMSMATKWMISLITTVIVVTGSVSAFVILQHNQQGITHGGTHTNAASASIPVSVSPTATLNTFAITGAVNGTLTNVTVSSCGETTSIAAYNLDLRGMLGDQGEYAIGLTIPDSERNAAGTFTFPTSAFYAIADFDSLTQDRHWYADSNSHGSVTITNSGGTIAALTLTATIGATGPVTISGMWRCA